MIELICRLTGFDYKIIESLSFWFWTITGISIVVGIIVTGKNWLIKSEWDNRNRKKLVDKKRIFKFSKSEK